jgi:hypothetical protein
MNVKQTIRLAHLYLETGKLELVKKLEEYPRQQFRFLKQFLDTLDDGSENTCRFDLDKMKLIYLENMCRLEPKKVTAELASRDYLLEESFLICERQKNYEGLSWISSKIGKLRDGVKYLLMNLGAVVRDRRISDLYIGEQCTAIFKCMEQIIASEEIIDFQDNLVSEGEGEVPSLYKFF